MWIFWINFILLMSSCKSWEYFFGVSLELCDEPIEDKPCTLTCISKYFVMAKSLMFMKDNYEYASCTIDKVSSLEDETWKCTYNYPGRRFITHQTRWRYFVYLNITHLSRARDQGSWTCQFTGMRSTPKALTVLNFFGVSLELCDEPIEDKPCTLTCISKYFVMAKSLMFMKDNYEYASCTIDKVSSLEDETWKCTYNYPGRRFITHQTRWRYFVYLNITHLSRARDQGSWTCQFTGMRSTPKALTVLTTIPVTLELCKEPIKDKPCAIKCTSRYFRATKSLVFKKDNTEYAFCKVDDESLPWNCTCHYPGRCFTTKQYHSSDHVFLNITQLNRARDQGLWTCQFKGYKSEARDLAVLTAPTHTCMSGDTNINFCTGGSSATYDATMTVACSSAVNISAVLSAPITGSSYTERLEVTKGSMCSDPNEHLYTAVYTITGTTALTGSGNTLTFETQLSGGVGMVHRDVFASNLTFTCL